jgi:hypothetical protein
MAEPFQRPHIGSIENFSSPESYKYPKKVQVNFPTKPRNRNVHGRRVLRQLESIKRRFDFLEEQALPEDIVRDDVIYVEFISEWDYDLKFEQLHSNAKKPDYQILNIRREKRAEDDEKYRIRVAVMLKKGGISHFINKVRKYINEDTRWGTPVAKSLVANIDKIQLATLESFWADYPKYSFPDHQEVIWWEVWFRKTEEDDERLKKVFNNVNDLGIVIGKSELEFPEHRVRLLKGTAEQLSKSLMLLDNLAELRKPEELADFITKVDLTLTEKEYWMDDLKERTEFHLNQNSTVVCLLDSGVNHLHSLLQPVLPENRIYTYDENWGKHDGESGGGHGTAMAGLALYGDLNEALFSPFDIKIYHGLESFKVYNRESPNDPELYGAITEYACSTPIVDFPENRRVFCISVTNKDFVFEGRPSSSSASVDKIAFGSILEPKEPQLILVSGGNVYINHPDEYPRSNFYQSVEDPGQAYNAITVGSYTAKDRIDSDVWPGWEPLAINGEMAPSNSTSTTWDTQWPNKPDIVMEGGNLAKNGELVDYKDSLQLLTTHKNHRLEIFQAFGDTSAAVALASKIAAELREQYPDYWPETIRGLMVHSADWTPAMLQGRDIKNNEKDRRAVLRSVGYGVPNFEKASMSANNSLTMIAQNEIIPYRKEKSTIKYNDFHLYELPWPSDVLMNEIGMNDATLKVTLSYYIEPNPGNRQYARDFRYHSHELDFNLIKRSETAVEFKRRISAAASGTVENEDESIDTTSELWTLRERVRSKGSIKKDFITTSGVELSRRNLLAIYPKNGWYRSRKALGKFNSKVRYSLIISIETPITDIDIYTPVHNVVETLITT